MPFEDPDAKWPEKLAGVGRWLRLILHGAAALLCGPIAGLSALLACVVVGDALHSRPVEAHRARDAPRGRS